MRFNASPHFSAYPTGNRDDPLQLRTNLTYLGCNLCHLLCDWIYSSRFGPLLPFPALPDVDKSPPLGAAFVGYQIANAVIALAPIMLACSSDIAFLRLLLVGV